MSRKLDWDLQHRLRFTRVRTADELAVGPVSQPILPIKLNRYLLLSAVALDPHFPTEAQGLSVVEAGGYGKITNVSRNGEAFTFRRIERRTSTVRMLAEKQFSQEVSQGANKIQVRRWIEGLLWRTETKARNYWVERIYGRLSDSLTRREAEILSNLRNASPERVFNCLNTKSLGVNSLSRPQTDARKKRPKKRQFGP